MRLRELTEHIKEALSIYCNSVFFDSPYETWQKMRDVKYVSACCPLINIDVVDNLVNYQFNLYVGDRLQVGKQNELDAIDNSWVIIEKVVKRLEQVDGILNIEQIGRYYNPFTQQFNDVLAGVYLTLQIQVKNDIDLCDIIREEECNEEE